MIKLVHRFAALAAILTIGTFFSSTLAVEALGDPTQIAWLKSAIVTPGLWLLIPALAATGISGNLLARGRSFPVLSLKKRRMSLAAANGLLVMVPCALLLDRLASQGDLGALFYSIQALELLGGAVNLALLGLNLRDGLRMVRHRVPQTA